MRPYVLRGHTRPLTQVIYNREGDLFFTTSKDAIACIWFSSNCERLGTFGTNEEGVSKYPDQHRNAIWSIDVSYDSTEAITTSADMTCKLWDVSNGKVKHTFSSQECPGFFQSSVRCCHYSLDNNLFCATQDRQMQAFCKVAVVDKRQQGTAACWQISTEILMNTRAKFGIMDEHIHTADEKGLLKKWDWRNIRLDEKECGIPVDTTKVHNQKITDMKFNKDRTFILTTSKDKTAKVTDAFNYDALNTFNHPSHVNTADFSPVKPHICVAGGMDASLAARSAGKGHFETYIYNMISTDEVCMFRGHFGPVNTIAFHPKGTQIVTGGEEGFIRCNPLDDSYVNYADFNIDLIEPDNVMIAAV